MPDQHEQPFGNEINEKPRWNDIRWHESSSESPLYDFRCKKPSIDVEPTTNTRIDTPTGGHEHHCLVYPNDFGYGMTQQNYEAAIARHNAGECKSGPGSTLRQEANMRALPHLSESLPSKHLDATDDKPVEKPYKYVRSDVTKLIYAITFGLAAVVFALARTQQWFNQSVFEYCSAIHPTSTAMHILNVCDPIAFWGSWIATAYLLVMIGDIATLFDNYQRVQEDRLNGVDATASEKRLHRIYVRMILMYAILGAVAIGYSLTVTYGLFV